MAPVTLVVQGRMEVNAHLPPSHCDKRLKLCRRLFLKSELARLLFLGLLFIELYFAMP